MIGRLTGQLAHKGLDQVLLDVSGVGYIIFVSERTLQSLPAVGQMVSLHTELLVREDLLQLFGFQSAGEREWHRLLCSVQGIGAKASMAILGTLGADGVARAISLGDASAIKAAPGVGPKIAARVVNELKDKAPRIMAMMEPSALQVPSHEGAAGPLIETLAAQEKADFVQMDVNASAEALSALSNLGYLPGDAAHAVARAQEDGAINTSDLIRAALKVLAPKGRGE